MSLASDWIEAKAVELAAIDRRRTIEDALKAEFNISETLEGTKTVESGEYKVKVTGRIDRKVDAEKLQELAAEAGLSDHLSSLFRWSPTLNMGTWKAADASITKPLAAAITAKPGRPSFAISLKSNNEEGN